MKLTNKELSQAKKEELIVCPKHKTKEISKYHPKSKHYSKFACGCVCNKDGSWEY